MICRKMLQQAIRTVLVMTLVGCTASATSFEAPTPTPVQVRVLSQDQIEGERLTIYKIAFQVIGASPYDLVMDTTVNFCIQDHYDSRKQELPSLTEKTWSNFVTINSQNQSLQAVMKDKLTISLLSDDELSEIWNSENSYDFLSAKHSGANGIYYVSQIGFNDEFTKSLVMVGTYDIDPDELSGYAYLVLLGYISGSWVETEKIIACNA